MAENDNRGVIDARERFAASRRGGSEKQSPEEIRAAAEANQAKRLRALERHAGQLRVELDKPKLLSKPDRSVIVRNLGRLVERAFKGAERKAASAIFKRAYGRKAALHRTRSESDTCVSRVSRCRPTLRPGSTTRTGKLSSSWLRRF